MEVFLLISVALIVYPNNVYLNRGNHEDHVLNLRYDFSSQSDQQRSCGGEREQNITIAIEVDLLFIIQNFVNTFNSIKFIHRERNQVLQSFALDMVL